MKPWEAVLTEGPHKDCLALSAKDHGHMKVTLR